MHHLQLYNHLLYRSDLWTSTSLKSDLAGIDLLDLGNATQIRDYYKSTLRRDAQVYAQLEAILTNGQMWIVQRFTSMMAPLFQMLSFGDSATEMQENICQMLYLEKDKSYN